MFFTEYIEAVLALANISCISFSDLLVLLSSLHYTCFFLSLSLD